MLVQPRLDGRVPVWFLLIAAMLFAAPACSGHSALGDPISSERLKGAIRALALPDLALNRAEARLTSICMTRSGFLYPIDSQERGYGRSIFGMAGHLTALTARAHGYGDAIDRGPLESVDPLTAYLDELPAADQRRFFESLAGSDGAYLPVEGLDGRILEVPTLGCAAEARKAIYESLEGFVSLARFPTYLFGYGAKIRTYPDFLNAESAYAACMRKVGYKVGGTGAALDLARSRFDALASNPATVAGEGTSTLSGSPAKAGIATPGEVRMALSDATCQHASGVYEAWDKAGFDVAESWINGNAEVILDLKESQEESLIRAREVLAD
jgi:hypothetical protein